MTRILAVDDHTNFLKLLTQLLASRSYEVFTAVNGQEALDSLDTTLPDVVILDIGMAGLNGLEVLKQIKSRMPKTEVIMMTGNATIETALESLQLGAYDYITKPFDADDLMWTIERALGPGRAGPASQAITVQRAADGLVANSDAMMEAAQLTERLASASVPVLMTGEKGTGKRQIALALHRLSGRPADKYFSLDCERLRSLETTESSDGGDKEDLSAALDMLEGGTICFEAVEALPHAMQEELLKVLDIRHLSPGADPSGHTLDVRVLATSSADLERYAGQGLFLPELFSRLRNFVIPLKPLRERREDILPLAMHFLEQRFDADTPDLTPDARAVLEHYDWPGNLRELKAVIDATQIDHPGSPITRTGLPDRIISEVMGADTPQSTDAPADEGRAHWLHAFLRSKARLTEKK